MLAPNGLYAVNVQLFLLETLEGGTSFRFPFIPSFGDAIWSKNKLSLLNCVHEGFCQVQSIDWSWCFSRWKCHLKVWLFQRRRKSFSSQNCGVPDIMFCFLFEHVQQWAGTTLYKGERKVGHLVRQFNYCKLESTNSSLSIFLFFSLLNSLMSHEATWFSHSGGWHHLRCHTASWEHSSSILTLQ